MDKKQHMEECVPKMIAQGEDPDKAVAMCSSAYASEDDSCSDCVFSSEEEALNFAAMIGLTGAFKHVASDGITYWFPGKDLEEFKAWYEVEELLMEMNDAD